MRLDIHCKLRIWLGALGLLGASLASAQTVVAEATMVIGDAQITAIDGQARALARGGAVREGERIQTGPGGHVHLRFVDGARLSVRPASRLQIENYSQADARNAQTAIRFKLEEGVVRSITGEWGEAARDRFRLNTPLAAIGVKGTDFSVAADVRQTLASVYTGAIVVTPMAESCSTTLGPCFNGTERQLSEAMQGQMLALTRQQITPQLVALADSPSGLRNTISAEAVTAPATVSAVVAAVPPSSGVATVAAAASTVRSDMANEKQVINESRAAAVSPPGPPEVKQLVWMRLPWTQPHDADTLSQAFDAAIFKANELATSNGAYALLRPLADDRSFMAAEGKADFRLAGAAAQLISRSGPDTRVDPLAVHSGRLQVDFSRSAFSTQLHLSGEPIGNLELNATGRIGGDGAIVGHEGNMNTRGSLSKDGREAGYFFSSDQSAGQVRGITSWGR